jgi:hypothetical protein
MKSIYPLRIKIFYVSYRFKNKLLHISFYSERRAWISYYLGEELLWHRTNYQFEYDVTIKIMVTI